MEIDGKKVPEYFKVVGWISAGVVLAGLLVIYNTEVPPVRFEKDRVTETNSDGGDISIRPFATKAPASSGNPALDMPLDQLTERLAKKLESNPGDLAGWTLLARSYSTLGDPERSRQAFDRALKLAPNDVDLRVTVGETLILAAEGKITPEAERSFVLGSAIDPDHPGVRYYLALADFQAGRTDEAFRAWRKLASDTPRGAPWQKRVEEQLAQAAIPPAALSSSTDIR
jgi:cytochrome c-type biogenesis protein CcmH/NrfG